MEMESLKRLHYFLFLIISSFLIKDTTADQGRVVCYVTNWSVYRTGTAKFNPQYIAPNLCTHLIYAYSRIENDTVVPTDEFQDFTRNGYSKFVGHKKLNPNLKTLLALGGSGEGSKQMSPIAADPDRRKLVINSILSYLRKYNFDGIDLVWNYPTFNGGQPYDKDNYPIFARELREAIDRESSESQLPRLILTMAIPQLLNFIEKGFDIPKLNEHVDWFHVLTYNYHRANENSTAHAAPLYGDDELNVNFTINHYLQAGATRNKLVLTMPTYARTYTLSDESNTEIGAPTNGPGREGELTVEKGQLAYYEICDKLRSEPGWTIVQSNSSALGPYAFNKDFWIAYDDENIVRIKSEYAADNGLGGIAFWSIDEDDFRGTCTGQTYPIIEAAKEALLDKIGSSDSRNVQIPRATTKATTTTTSTTTPRTTTINIIPEFAPRTLITTEANIVPSISNQDTQVSNNIDASPTFTKLLELTNQLGGVDHLEKLLRDMQSSNKKVMETQITTDAPKIFVASPTKRLKINSVLDSNEQSKITIRKDDVNSVDTNDRKRIYSEDHIYQFKNFHFTHRGSNGAITSREASQSQPSVFSPLQVINKIYQ